MRTAFKIIFSLCVFSVSVEAFGQEMRKCFDTCEDRHSIVRELNQSNWLVCHYDGTYSNFSRVNVPGIAAHSMRVPESSLRIYDFEIYDDTVFFCGYNNNVAVLGYFDMNSFPTSSISLIHFDKYPFVSFKKLDVFRDPSTLHVVMTAHSYEKSFLVDAMPTGAYTWDLHLTPNTDTNYHFEDVAVTDGYVVATDYFHLSGTFSPAFNGKIWFFHRPTLPATPLFPVTASYIETPFVASSPFLIEHCHADTVAITTSTYPNGSIGCATYEPVSLISAARIQYGDIWDYQFDLIDLKYNKKSGELDILINPEGENQSSSIIYHLSSRPAFVGGIAIGHFFSGERLKSLDYLFLQPDNFIATGNEFAHNILKVYRYNYNLWEECTAKYPFESVIIEKTQKKDDLNYERMTYEVRAMKITGISFLKWMHTECGAIYGEDELIEQEGQDRNN